MPYDPDKFDYHLEVTPANYRLALTQGGRPCGVASGPPESVPELVTRLAASPSIASLEYLGTVDGAPAGWIQRAAGTPAAAELQAWLPALPAPG